MGQTISSKEELQMKSSKKEQNTFYKVLLVPLVIAFTFRYLPYAFYGNSRIYEKEVPLAVIDGFLPETSIVKLQALIKRERRFATAVEASGDTGVKSIGEHTLLNLDNTCPEVDMFSTDGKTCNFGGRIDLFQHFHIYQLLSGPGRRSGYQRTVCHATI